MHFLFCFFPPDSSLSSLKVSHLPIGTEQLRLMPMNVTN
uniref:Uncharacterized protein n=1 Tax=Anguilla anguilla TaxID=7936 RepID=A0A0E9R047_ANGAN